MDENTVAVGKDIDLETVILQNVDLAESIGAFREVAEQFQQLMMMQNLIAYIYLLDFLF